MVRATKHDGLTVRHEIPSHVRPQVQPEERQFVFPSGKQAEVLVSRLAPGKFRVEEYLFPVAAVVDEGDIPDSAGMGWLIEADELTEGLQVRRLVEDPNVEFPTKRDVERIWTKCERERVRERARKSSCDAFSVAIVPSR
jgi:hypothetical protein